MAWRGSGAGVTNRGSGGIRGGAAFMELPPQLGPYRVKEKLGGGAMGSVYLVENTKLEREEALKVPHFRDDTDSGLLERFLREARSAAKLDHANLCPIYDAGVLDGIYYLTMRYLKGKLLSDYSGQAQPTRKAVEIVTKLAQALETAHVKGVVHRDLKPSNIMMVAGVGPVVMDFGLAQQVQQVDTRLTQAGATLGTPAYMPPEQVNGDLEQMGPPSDVYSLGVVLYELLTGRLPFEGTMASIFGQILYVTPPLPSKIVPGLDPALDGICRKAMAKAAGERYPSMKAFAAALTAYHRSIPATEGLGNLIPTAGNQAAVFQARTVAPGPQPAANPDIFRAQTVAPQRRSSISPPTVVIPAPKTTLSNRDANQTFLEIRVDEDREDEARSGHSSGANRTGALYLTLALVTFAAVGVMGWVMTTKPGDHGLAQASQTNDPPGKPTTGPHDPSSASPPMSTSPESEKESTPPKLDTPEAPETVPGPEAIAPDPSTRPESTVSPADSARPTDPVTPPANVEGEVSSPTPDVPKSEPKTAPPATILKPVAPKPTPKAKPDPAALRARALAKLEKAKGLMGQRKMKEALPIYEEVAKEFPGTHEGGIAEAQIEAIRNSLSAHRFDDMWFEAEGHEQKGEKQKAKNIFQRIADESPDLTQRGKALYRIMRMNNSSAPYNPPNHGVTPRG